jgi:outer membrane protein TolC
MIGRLQQLKQQVRAARAKSRDAEIQLNAAQEQCSMLSRAREEAEHAFQEAIAQWLAASE